MAKKAADFPGSHRLIHTASVRTRLERVDAGEKRDVFEKDGTPHMIVELSNNFAGSALTVDVSKAGMVAVVNLVSGSCWALPGETMVEFVEDVRLTYSRSE